MMGYFGNNPGLQALVIRHLVGDDDKESGTIVPQVNHGLGLARPIVPQVGAAPLVPGGLPPRTANTMSDAIAMSSPNGRMSGRAQAAAQKRLSEALFGPGGLIPTRMPQPAEEVTMLRQAKEFRSLASRGMQTKKLNKQAEALEAKAAALGATYENTDLK